MNKLLNSVLAFFCAACLLSSCNQTDYNANLSSSPVNQSINPLVPLTSDEFTWKGTAPVSADINGTHWIADSVTYQLSANGTNIITAHLGVSTMILYLNSVYGGSVYNMGYNQGLRITNWVPDDTAVPQIVYTSFAGNSGEVKILENKDSLISGQFYFQGLATNKDVVAVTNGYFYINKYTRN